MKTLATLFFSLFLFSLSPSIAAPKYDKIWEFYTTSKYDEALALIEEGLLESPKDVLLLDLNLQIIKNRKDYKTSIELMKKLIDAAPNPNPYMFSNYSLFSFGSVSSTDEDLLERVLSELLENPKLDATMLAVLRENLGNYYLARHQRARAEASYGSIGAISEWSLLGPFENLMGNGFDKYQEVIDNPSKTTFKGKYNASISWYPLKYNIPGRWIHLGNYCFTSRALVFAQTFCISPVEQDVYLRIGISGSLKVFVNDALVLKENQEINNGIDAMSVKVHLNAGNNRIVIQLGNSESSGRVNFNIRLTDANYKLVENLTYTTVVSDYKKATLAQVPPREAITYIKFFNEQAAAKGVFEYYN